jgi:hypothetical protein
MQVALPGNNTPAAYATLLKGLKVNGTARATLANAGIDDTDNHEVTFELDADGVPTGSLKGYTPLELELWLVDGTTAVAGRWNSDLQGDTSADTVYEPIGVSGVLIDVYDIVRQDGKIFIKFDEAPTAGGIRYRIRTGRHAPSE